MVSYSVAVNGRTEERLWSCTHVPILGKDGQTAFLLKNAQDMFGTSGLGGRRASIGVGARGRGRSTGGKHPGPQSDALGDGPAIALLSHAGSKLHVRIARA